ncbi:fluoride efflux transporter FluC [Microbacterium hominis]|uniref:fluoride efflux transporter FluC n=1 Tax=Microbacterium hominis TaxID=162426 RepID=UPI000A3E9651|nr:CrcB family protein [Microbacterium hominis]
MPPARRFSLVALLLVIVGGMVGVALRAVVVVPLTAAGLHPLVVPAATLVVNLIGSLLLGVIVGWLADRHPRARLFLGTGVMGGFTTYSAFAVQAVTTATASPFVGIALIVVSLFGGVLAAVAGLAVGRRLADRPGEIERPEDAE